MAPLLVENVTKTFLQGNRSVTALSGISLDVVQSRFLAIMGASGSGKSTLLHLMAGLAKPDAGKILIDGTDITTMNDRQLTLFRRRRIGLVFQSFNLIPTLTAEENIALPLMLEGVKGSTLKQKVGELMTTLGIEGRRRHRPDAMSGGEQQRVAIGRALVTDATVILADEPTGNLDSGNSRSVCEVLRNLSTHHNKAIVMVTHEPAVAAYANEVAVIRDGKLIDRFDAPGPDHGQELAARYQACLNR
jgi:putative ABC transport system ATP-binding protein